MVALDSCEW